MARTASTRPRSSGKRNRVRERWEQRGFSPAGLLNLWASFSEVDTFRCFACGGVQTIKIVGPSEYRQAKSQTIMKSNFLPENFRAAVQA